MPAKLTITLSDDALAALNAKKAISITVTAGGRSAARGGGDAREGSLPARVVAWAKEFRKEFGTKQISKQFKLSRAHASMLLSKLASDGSAIKRKARGLYAHKG